MQVTSVQFSSVRLTRGGMNEQNEFKTYIIHYTQEYKNKQKGFKKNKTQKVIYIEISQSNKKEKKI
jgi:hypothetical protein